MSYGIVDLSSGVSIEYALRYPVPPKPGQLASFMELLWNTGYQGESFDLNLATARGNVRRPREGGVNVFITAENVEDLEAARREILKRIGVELICVPSLGDLPRFLPKVKGGGWRLLWLVATLWGWLFTEPAE